MIVLYSKKKLDYTKIKDIDIPISSYAHSAKILNISYIYIKERIKNTYRINKSSINTILANRPLPIYIGKYIVIWEDKFILNMPSSNKINWESLNIIIALSGAINKVDTYNYIIDKNLQVKQDIMYLSVQLSEVHARIYEFQHKQKYDYFDFTLFRQILRRRKIRNTISNNSVVLNFTNVKIGNNKEGYVIYNNILIYVSRFGVIEGFILKFNNFYFSSFWNIKDVILHPNLFTPYYIDTPIISYDYEIFINSIIDTVYNKNNNSLNKIILEFNRYRRIWNSIKYNIVNSNSEVSIKDIFMI